MTAMFRSRWMDWEKSNTSKVGSAKGDKSPSGTSGTSMDRRFDTLVGEHHENENPSPVVCLFCQQPVERGTPGTGALGGEDLHMDCYWRQHPK